MKRRRTFMTVAAFVAAVTFSAAQADDHRHGHHHHGHHHGHGHHHAWHHGPPHGFRGHHFHAPRPHYYGPAPLAYRQPAHRWYRDDRPLGGGSATLAIAAGGVLGGIVGNEAGYGNPAAIIGGSVLGSVLGHEIVRH